MGKQIPAFSYCTLPSELHLWKYQSAAALDEHLAWIDLGYSSPAQSDYDPKRLKDFIRKFNPDVFGINYDTGNSAALGFHVKEEFYYYGNYIKGVHIKDRILKGKTVRLGEGNVNFKLFFKLLKRIKYKNHIIFQTARSQNKKDVQEMKIN